MFCWVFLKGRYTVKKVKKYLNEEVLTFIGLKVPSKITTRRYVEVINTKIDVKIKDNLFKNFFDVWWFKKIRLTLHKCYNRWCKNPTNPISPGCNRKEWNIREIFNLHARFILQIWFTLWWCGVSYTKYNTSSYKTYKFNFKIYYMFHVTNV